MMAVAQQLLNCVHVVVFAFISATFCLSLWTVTAIPPLPITALFYSARFSSLLVR